MNRIPFDRQVSIVSALTEGASIRSIERMTGTHRDSIMRLGVRVGEACAQLLDEQMRGLTIQRLELDEIWTFVQKKQRHLTVDDDAQRMGDHWAFLAFDPDSKAVPSYRVGKRDAANTTAFVCDAASRIVNRPQVSSDAMEAYIKAVEIAWGGDVDYGMIVKSYEVEPAGPGRYSPPRVSSVERYRIQGNPDPAFISTSGIERFNLAVRTSMRRFTRLCSGFSRKPENLTAALALWLAAYNYTRINRSIRSTPAMRLGVTKTLWSVSDLVALAKW